MEKTEVPLATLTPSNFERWKFDITNVLRSKDLDAIVSSRAKKPMKSDTNTKVRLCHEGGRSDSHRFMYSE